MLPQSDQNIALHLEAGRRAHEAGDFDAAVTAYQAALRIQEEDPKLLFLLGNSLLQSGQTAAALVPLERAAARQRNHPAVIGSLAQAYFEVGRHSDAENLFRKACRLDPGDAHYQIGLANALAMQQKFSDAETLLKRAVVRFPDSAFAWMNLGNVARDQARPEEAIAHYRSALRCDARLLNARNNLGSTLHAMLRFEEAEREYRACIDADAEFFTAYTNLASVLIDLGRFTEAENLCRELLVKLPDFAGAHAMLASAIGSQGRLTEALPHFREAATRSPDTQRYAESYACALFELGDIDEGLRQFGTLLRTCEDTQTTTQILMPLMLANGFFTEGWSRHRSRPTFARIQRHFQRLNLQQSLPPDPAGKHICVVCEQGLGDELFFLRYAAQLKARGARITYCTNPKLGTLLQRFAVLDQIIDTPDDIPPADVNILVGDLPHALCALDTTLTGEYPGDFPWERPPYALLPPPSVLIPPLPEALTAVREMLSRAGPPPYLGITWRGGTAPDHQRGLEWKLYKEIAIPKLATALHSWPGTFLALQRNPAPGEMAAMQAALGRPLADFTALNDNLEHMLALLSVIDDYVGVSNTNTHLRAAVNKTARVLIPCPADWRWMAAGASPWFPGFSLYRQAFDGRWDGALDALRSDLARFCGGCA